MADEQTSIHINQLVLSSPSATAWDAYGACFLSEDGEDMAVMMIVEA